MTQTLPGEYFSSSEIYDQETHRVFQDQWICLGRASEIPYEGDFFLRELDQESLIVVRNERGGVSCFYNVCRHRGTRLLGEPHGCLKRRILCPYHAWSYNFCGELKAAPNMADVNDFQPSDYPLKTLACQVWRGFIMVSFRRAATPFENTFAGMAGRFDDWRLAELVTAHREVYHVRANWKIVFQNYSECYHCSHVHPQLTPMTSVKSASNDFPEGPFLGGPMILTESCQTLSTDGQLCGTPFAGLKDDDRQRVYFYTLFPTLFISPHPDYVLTHRIERHSPNETRIVCEWLFDPDVMAGPGFDPSRAVEFWDLTNRQDWRVCELTQRGVESAAYTPGPYSNLESMLAAFDRYYLSRMHSQDDDRL